MHRIPLFFCAFLFGCWTAGFGQTTFSAVKANPSSTQTWNFEVTNLPAIGFHNDAHNRVFLDFGDGTYAEMNQYQYETPVEFTHTYSRPGTFHPTLEITKVYTNDKGSDIIFTKSAEPGNTGPIIVLPGDVSPITFPGPSGSEINLFPIRDAVPDDTLTFVISYEWICEDADLETFTRGVVEFEFESQYFELLGYREAKRRYFHDEKEAAVSDDGEISTLAWNYDSLPGNTPRNLIVTLYGNPKLLKLAGKNSPPVTFRAIHSPAGSGSQGGCKYDKFKEVTMKVVGAHDPNRKTVNPPFYAGGGPQEFDFYIEFQNYGTGQVVNVLVTDSLDAKLDISSLTRTFMNGGGQPFPEANLGVDINPSVDSPTYTWTFSGIGLRGLEELDPAGMKYPPIQTMGDIGFSIKTKPGTFNPGDTIRNVALVEFMNYDKVRTDPIYIPYTCCQVVIDTTQKELRVADLYEDWSEKRLNSPNFSEAVLLHSTSGKPNLADGNLIYSELPGYHEEVTMRVCDQDSTQGCAVFTVRICVDLDGNAKFEICENPNNFWDNSLWLILIILLVIILISFALVQIYRTS